MLLESAIGRLYTLNVGVTGVAGERHERPHKPLLLLAAFDLIDEGLAGSRWKITRPIFTFRVS